MIQSWYIGDLPQDFFYLAGYAGTGKTTLIKEFIDGISTTQNWRISGAAYTGKAALRMRQTGFRGARTIHSLIYKPERDANGDLTFTLNDNSDLVGADLLILDESSMVDEPLGKDLLSFEVPILVIGDPGQLPPIKGSGFFTHKPDALLSTVHRQALDSNIVRLATEIRAGDRLRKESHDDLIVFATQEEIGDIESYDQIIVGMNKTRVNANFRYRERTNRNPQANQIPLVDEKLICTKNNRKLGIFNGMICWVDEIKEEEDYIILSVMDEEGRRIPHIRVHKECFLAPEELPKMHWKERSRAEEFDFGYAITVHKAQGSEWDNVLLIDDGIFVTFSQATRKPWLYTGITRASKRLTIARGGVR